MDRIKQYFQFDQFDTTWRREIIAGLTTFVSMAYILFVNPNVLGVTGMNKSAVFTATALAGAFGSLLMGIFARYPVAMAPTLGINAFFAYTVVLGMHVSWQTALAAVFVASLLLIVITSFKIRDYIINAIPRDLKLAISAGIGLFITFIGLQEGGLVVADKATLVKLGSLTNNGTWLTVVGLVITIILFSRQVPAAVFVGMICTALIGIIAGLIKVPHQLIGSAPSLHGSFLVALHNINHINTVQMWIIVITFLLVTFFDTAGTLVGLTEQAGIVDGNHIPRIGNALVTESTSMMMGSLLGTSPVGAFVESSAGIAVGGRTGVVAIVVGLLFLVSLFFSPILAVVTNQVTAPALILVGILMAKSLGKIDWQHFEIAVPAFFIVIGMPLTYSVSDGIALGFIMYPITMIMAHRRHEINPIMYGLALIFLIFMAILMK